MMFKQLVGVVLFVIHVAYKPADSGAVQVTADNVDTVLAEHKFAFINFYADWCRFSNMLAPIFDEAADKVAQEFPETGGVVMAKVDCDSNAELGTRFHITKYPTLKYVVNGQLAKKEYRGQRSVEAFVDFIRDKIREPVEEYFEVSALNSLDEKKRHLIGYFESKESPEFENFRKASMSFRDDCLFHAGFGEASKLMHPPSVSIVAFRPNTARTTEPDETFTGDIKDYASFSTWAEEKCTALVREITFENAEELTEEGLPFLILFHAPDDDESVKKFNNIVRSELLGERKNVNFLVADGITFAHPLHHLGKSKEDLPIIAIDSFRHMFLFPKFEDMEIKGKMKKFLADLYSGKLHREFHYGPDPDEYSSTDSDDSETPDSRTAKNALNEDAKSLPPPSQFQHLGPSRNRYTLLRDEF